MEAPDRGEPSEIAVTNVVAFPLRKIAAQAARAAEIQTDDACGGARALAEECLRSARLLGKLGSLPRGSKAAAAWAAARTAAGARRGAGESMTPAEHLAHLLPLARRIWALEAGFSLPGRLRGRRKAAALVLLSRAETLAALARARRLETLDLDPDEFEAMLEHSRADVLDEASLLLAAERAAGALRSHFSGRIGRI